MFELITNQSLPILIGAFESIRGSALAIGIGGVVGGIILFLNHRRHWEEVAASNVAQRIFKFELRKFRRRSINSGMITSAGMMMAALFWVTEERIFSVFILMILGLLVAILGVALIDLFSVGLQQIATPDPKAEKAMIEEYLRQREKLAERKDLESQTSSES